MSDSNDVALAVAGDHQAFERLYRTYFGRIYSLCARLSASRERATALTEEVFVKAWEQLHALPADAPFAAWLCRLATEVTLSREGIVGGNNTAPSSNDSAGEGGNDVRTATAPRALELHQALALLQPAARGIFVLHDVEGYQHQEIAEIFGITVGASKARLQQARVLLKEALGR